MGKTNFIWAQGLDANVREPIKELAEKGWQHRDIPKASNMNWIFKQISEEFVALRKDMEQKAEELKSLLAVHSDKFVALRKDLEQKTEELKSVLTAHGNEIKKQQEAIGKLKKEQKSLSENHESLESYTERGLGKAFRGNEFNTGVTRAMCIQLEGLEQYIRHYHPDLPEFHWPLHKSKDDDA